MFQSHHSCSGNLCYVALGSFYKNGHRGHIFVCQGAGEERERMGRLARQVVEQNQGALQRTLEAIDRLLTPQQDASGSPLANRPRPLMAEKSGTYSGR